MSTSMIRVPTVNQFLGLRTVSKAATRRRAREGFGAIGNLGNTDKIVAGKYQVSGDGVAVRGSPSFAAGVVTRLNRGDVVQATSQVDGDESPGADPNFPKGTFVNFVKLTGPVEGWIATGYLSTDGSIQKPTIDPVDYKQVTETTTTTTTSKKDYTPYIIGGTALVGLVIVAAAASSSSKRKKRKRLKRRR